VSLFIVAGDLEPTVLALELRRTQLIREVFEQIQVPHRRSLSLLVLQVYILGRRFGIISPKRLTIRAFKVTHLAFTSSSKMGQFGTVSAEVLDFLRRVVKPLLSHDYSPVPFRLPSALPA
jgi:hypothetical protein